MMRSDNGNKTMRLNRCLSQWKVLPVVILLIDLIFFFGFTYMINVFSDLPLWMADKENVSICFGISQILPKIGSQSSFTKGFYLILFIGMALLDAILIYQIRVSFSETDVNIGTVGTSRWTTVDEIKKQYKSIPLSKEFYVGACGTIISRIRNRLYVDDSISNTLVLGTTRSGKGQMYVIPNIDTASRAEKVKDRPSMIINDPKLELYKSLKALLEERGYEVRLFNLIDPNKSMGYDPVQIVKEHYKAGRIEKAQMAAKTFAFSVFNAKEDTQEAIWKNTATDLFTALIVAITTDCIDADIELNRKREEAFNEKRQKFMQLDEKEQAIARDKLDKFLKENLQEDYILSDEICYIPGETVFEKIYPNEKKANCFSCLNFFKELCDRVTLQCTDLGAGRVRQFEKKAETALDDYFNQRPALDYAKALYQEIKSAGDRTKGSVYINMQSALSIFTLSNIAKMTAESDFDIEKIGFGERPVAIFMGIPANDRSNYFLATTFIAQVYQYIYDLAMAKTGVVKRKVRFMLDEFGNLPVIENFAGFVTVCLGVGISFDIYLQSYNQIYGKYKDEAKTILENFANQIYIKSIGKESAEEFSDMLGSRTEIQVERSGGRFSLSKQYMERAQERPLMYPAEFSVLKEGECVVYRGMKRSDRLKVAIESHPIINEYADKLNMITYLGILIKMLKSRLINKKAIMHPTEDRITKFKEEWDIRVNDKKRYYGTALLYAHQYLDEVSDPNKIIFDDICSESRDHIDIRSRVYEPDEVLKKIKLGKYTDKADMNIKKLKNYMKVKYKLVAVLGSDFMNILDISETDTVSVLKAAVTGCDKITEKEKGAIRLLIAQGE